MTVTADRVRQLLTYNPSTGEFFWKAKSSPHPTLRLGGNTMIFHCSSCDIYSKTAPLCMKGDAYVITDEGISSTERCTCVCHNGSAHAELGEGPDGRGPGVMENIDAEYEDLCVHSEMAAA